MKIKTKLTYGIGILFILILILGVVAGKYITDMSTDTRNILADNYQSLLTRLLIRRPKRVAAVSSCMRWLMG